MPDNDPWNSQPANNTQMATIGQNTVVAINGIINAINTRFPNWQTAPTNSTASGVAGQVAFSGTATTSAFFYVCISANQWGRTLLTTTF